MSASVLLVLAVIIPLLGSALVAVLGRHASLQKVVSILAGIFSFSCVLLLTQAVSQGDRPSIDLFIIAAGLNVSFSAEPLGIVFALVASFLWIVTTIYAIGYMKTHGGEGRTSFYAYFAIAIAAAMGVAFSANLLTLFIFYEVLTLSTYPLVTHSGTPEARKAGRIYLGMLLSTSIGLFLVAIVCVWGISGTLEFQKQGILAGKASPLLTGVLCGLFAFGVGKAALMPLHIWLPQAMVAPTPVSALLHAVAVVKAGVFTILKIMIYVFGIDHLHETGVSLWLAYLAGITIILGALIAMRQDNLKARLAYSTVSQLSYILLGAFIVTTWSTVGAGMHIVMHAFGKITLFFCAGAILVVSQKTKVSEMAGLGPQMPVTMISFMVGALSVIGLPPLGGMWSKWYLALGTIEAEAYILLIVLMLSSLLTIVYLLPIPLRAFFCGASAPSKERHEAPLPCLIAMVVTAVGSVLLFIFPQYLYDLLIQLIKP